MNAAQLKGLRNLNDSTATIETVDAELPYRVMVNGKHIASAYTYAGAREMLDLYFSNVVR
jgi:hypothetical protein